MKFTTILWEKTGVVIRKTPYFPKVTRKGGEQIQNPRRHKRMPLREEECPSGRDTRVFVGLGPKAPSRRRLPPTRTARDLKLYSCGASEGKDIGSIDVTISLFCNSSFLIMSFSKIFCQCLLPG